MPPTCSLVMAAGSGACARASCVLADGGGAGNGARGHASYVLADGGGGSSAHARASCVLVGCGAQQRCPAPGGLLVLRCSRPRARSLLGLRSCGQPGKQGKKIRE